MTGMTGCRGESDDKAEEYDKHAQHPHDSIGIENSDTGQIYRDKMKRQSDVKVVEVTDLICTKDRYRKETRPERRWTSRG